MAELGPGEDWLVLVKILEKLPVSKRPGFGRTRVITERLKSDVHHSRQVAELPPHIPRVMRLRT